MKIEVIQVSELEKYLQVVKAEQEFRVLLKTFKDAQELQLRKMQELKQRAIRLEALKQRTKLKDKDLDKEIRKWVNRSFKGGCFKCM